MTAIHYLKLIKSFGYRVYINKANPDEAEYCFYTDGENIGYAQWTSHDPGVSSVHKPCKSAGTSYSISDQINKATLAQALHTTCPDWDSGNWHNIKKWKNWDEYHNSSNWTKQYKEYQP